MSTRGGPVVVELLAASSLVGAWVPAAWRPIGGANGDGGPAEGLTGVSQG